VGGYGLGMANPQIAAWVTNNSGIFDELQDAVTRVAESARTARWELAAGADSQPALDRAGAMAGELLEAVRHGQEVDPIPDDAAEAAWTAGLSRWKDAAETITRAAAERDTPELERAGRALDAGTEEFLRAAAAFRRAS
jgi:hypothetical protein